MRLLLLLATLLVTTAAAPRQDTPVSSGGVISQALPSAEAQLQTLELPVSLDRIRDRLASPAPLQQTLLKRPTFKVEVEQVRNIQDLLQTIDFSGSRAPTPIGGLYGYEIQRVMLSSVSSPLLQQPYAAFSGGELLTLAFEGVLGKYLARKATDSLTAVARDRAEAAARASVARDIEAYCSDLPDRGSHAGICKAAPLQ